MCIHIKTDTHTQGEQLRVEEAKADPQDALWKTVNAAKACAGFQPGSPGHSALTAPSGWVSTCVLLMDTCVHVS